MTAAPGATPLPISDVALLDEILDHWRPALGADHRAYRHHALRVLNHLHALTGTLDERAVVAAAFHDLGIWTAHTFDYLEPSRALARTYLLERGRDSQVPAVDAAIAFHHKVTPYTGADAELVEAFREADWIDVTRGLRRFGLPASLLRRIRRALPNAGFHRRLLELGWHRLLAHPLAPLPMLRW